MYEGGLPRTRIPHEDLLAPEHHHFRSLNLADRCAALLRRTKFLPSGYIRGLKDPLVSLVEDEAQTPIDDAFRRMDIRVQVDMQAHQIQLIRASEGTEQIRRYIAQDELPRGLAEHLPIDLDAFFPRRRPISEIHAIDDAPTRAALFIRRFLIQGTGFHQLAQTVFEQKALTLQFFKAYLNRPDAGFYCIAHRL